jgi:hypothetical protein
VHSSFCSLRDTSRPDQRRYVKTVRRFSRLTQIHLCSLLFLSLPEIIQRKIPSSHFILASSFGGESFPQRRLCVKSFIAATANSRRAWHFDFHVYYHVIGFGHFPLRRLWLSLSR